jgi:hypothetical protein
VLVTPRGKTFDPAAHKQEKEEVVVVEVSDIVYPYQLNG